ncbi:hypothetical protein B0H16DRAFT_1563095 [Mycena metata]|uniref:DUF7702 domain-containing protein n=1 Tax=Mycena metata TaxID=1033252 RepID=A0AAD7IGH5_9AGAR|nr:hypothetical protein B0H16DRAFT_1563095 [Mycena metata]
MTSSSIDIDYAALFGIHSLAGAVIFAILFFPLGLWFIRQSIRNTTYVYIILALFCAMRVTAYIIRAIMANSVSEGSNLNLFIADQVLFGVGFFALLYSAYSLVLDRDVIAGGKGGSLLSPNPLRNPHAFRMILMAGVALSIVGTVDSTSSNPSDVSTGHTLRKAGTIIFFVLTVIQVAQSLWFFGHGSNLSKSGATHYFGDRNGRYLLCIISLLMLVREVFLTATLNNSTKQNDERLWYPLVALPEFLAVLCYAFSGLVPSRTDLKAARETRESGSTQKVFT